MTKPILTVIISTFNEAKNIAEAIDSVKKNIKTPHTIVVWDTSSTDQTVVFAKHAGAKVISHPP
ncbi:MAG: glycosyltransferase, partial [bacterium]|nr:glycosyltransferase [bacterium]